MPLDFPYLLYSWTSERDISIQKLPSKEDQGSRKKGQKLNLNFLRIYLNAGWHQELAELRIFQSHVQEVVVEVTAGLNSHHHARQHNSGRAKRFEAVTFWPFRVTFQISSDVVDVHAEEVTEAVRLEDAAGKVGGHHVVNVALQKAA